MYNKEYVQSIIRNVLNVTITTMCISLLVFYIVKIYQSSTVTKTRPLMWKDNWMVKTSNPKLYIKKKK